MPLEFKLPDLGENIDSADVIGVLVREGDEIQANQGIIEVETGKAVAEVPSPQAGRVVKMHVNVGDKLPIGALLMTLEASSPAASSPPPPAKPQPASVKQPPAAATPLPLPTVTTPLPPAAARTPLAPPPSAAHPVQVAYSAANGGEQGVSSPAGPATRRLARELGVELSRVEGSGPGGRITRDDVVATVRQINATAAPATPQKGALEPKPAVTEAPASPDKPTTTAPRAEGVADSDYWGPIRRAEMSKIRKTIAVNMARSSATIPHVTNFDSADVTELERIRQGTAADYAGSSVKLTSLAFVMKAVSIALRHHGTLNASLDMEAEQIIYKDYVNLGVAVDTDRGLVVPVVRNVDRLSIPQIAQALSDAAAKARGAQFTLDDLRGGTFTISNLGAVGGQYSTPIINHPEVAILLVGRAKRQPVVVDETRIEPRLILPMSLSYDHRIVDGATAGRFLNDVINYLEVPGRLLLAP